LFGLNRDDWDNIPVKVTFGLVFLTIILDILADLLGYRGVNMNHFLDWYFVEGYKEADVNQPDSAYASFPGADFVLFSLAFFIGETLSFWTVILIVKPLNTIVFRRILYLHELENRENVAMLFAIFPPAKLFYFGAHISLLLALLVYYFLRINETNKAVISAIIGGFFHPYNVFMFIFIPLYHIIHKTFNFKIALKSLLTPIGTVISFTFFYWTSGDFLAWYHNNQAYYERAEGAYTFPFKGFIDFFMETHSNQELFQTVFNLCFLLIGFAMVWKLREFDVSLIFFELFFLIYWTLSPAYYAVEGGIRRWSIFLFPYLIPFHKHLDRDKALILTGLFTFYGIWIVTLLHG